MTNKTISINPSLFSVNSIKTKKKREKTLKKNITPIISPNVLKNRLLKRIKEHKQKETQNLIIDKNKIKSITTDENNATLKSNSNNEMLNFNDEFMDSINYLQTLSKQKNIENENRINMLNNQKRKEEIERKTVKNYFSMNEQPVVNIDLPEELVQPILQITQSEPISINPYTGMDMPYGILKGGKKPTYKEWSRTVRNNVVTNPNAALTIHGPNISSEIHARENRLNLLKQKIKSKNEETIVDPFLTENLIKKNVDTNDNIDEHSFNNLSSEKPQNEVKIDSISNINTNNIDGTLIGTKHITKKTIKRKYTLGRSQIKKTVSVLIKDNRTRKTILMAQKELKRKNINDIKIYLKEHNLIKTGSNAPNDVLRKLYESSMLTGEITNSNVDTLLHNFSKEEKKL
jgi:hypothetical protein